MSLFNAGYDISYLQVRGFYQVAQSKLDVTFDSIPHDGGGRLEDISRAERHHSVQTKLTS